MYGLPSTFVCVKATDWVLCHIVHTFSKRNLHEILKGCMNIASYHMASLYEYLNDHRVDSFIMYAIIVMLRCNYPRIPHHESYLYRSLQHSFVARAMYIAYRGTLLKDSDLTIISN